MIFLLNDLNDHLIQQQDLDELQHPKQQLIYHNYPKITILLLVPMKDFEHFLE
jgi:hypothetical protein